MEIKLSKSQEEAYKGIMHSLHAGGGCHVISGGAGTGKTTLINYIAEEVNLLEKSMCICASTGIAANLYEQGITAHRAFKLPIGDVHLDPTMNFIAQGCDLVVIDEVSMISSVLMNLILERIAKAVEQDVPAPVLVLVGDTAQLPPVVVEPELKEYIREYFSGCDHFYAPEVVKKMYELFGNIEFYQLDTVFRQEDPTFIEMLTDIRLGQNLDSVAETFNLLCGNKSPVENDVIRVFPANYQVDKYNAEMLEAHPGELFESTMRLFGDAKAGDAGTTPYKLQLKVGARVMFTQNMYRREKDTGAFHVIAVNGEMGTVSDITAERDVMVMLDRGEIVRVPYMLREIGKLNMELSNGSGGNIYYKTSLGSWQQYPLRLCWALTIHKSQGQSFEHIHADFTKGVRESLAYVALSRARSLKGLTFKGKLTANHLRACPPITSSTFKLGEENVQLF